MFQIIKPDDRAANKALLKDMFENRYRVVVEQWGWTIPGIARGHDEDQFDTEDTIYSVVVDEDSGRVVGSSRLNPTTRPHMLSELFADYCDLQPYPELASVWECSRYVIDKTMFKDPVREFRHRAQIGIGLTQCCLDNDISELSWLTHKSFYNLVLAVWETEPLGLARRGDDGSAWIAARSKIDAAALSRQLSRFNNAEEVVAAHLGKKGKTDREGKAA